MLNFLPIQGYWLLLLSINQFDSGMAGLASTVVPKVAFLCYKIGFVRFITTLRGHVQAVYMVAWSADSRLLVSGSADSTLKGEIAEPIWSVLFSKLVDFAVWSVKNKKLELDLPGHADEVFAVDWSPDGQRVASGGKDKVLKMYENLLMIAILMTLVLLLSGGKINKFYFLMMGYITKYMALFIVLLIARI